MKNLLLDYYHCTFFLAFSGLETLRPKGEPMLFSSATANEDEDQDEDDAQAWLYFSPTQRDILFQKKVIRDHAAHPKPMEEWRLDNNIVNGLSLHLGKEENSENPLLYQRAVFRSVRLYRYFNGIYILAFTVEPELQRCLREEQTRRKKECEAELIDKFEKEQGRQPDAEEREEIEHKEVPELLAKDRGVLLYRNNCPVTAEGVLDVYGDEARDYPQMQLEAWLRFTRLARQLYASFTEQDQEHKISPLVLNDSVEKMEISAFDKKLEIKIPDNSVDLLSPIVLYLLQKFFSGDDHSNLPKISKENIRLDDDRMHVSVAYSLVEKCLDREELERLFSLALYVDRIDDTWSSPGMDGWAYTPQVVRERMARQKMSLWEGRGGYFGYTDYSAAAFYPDAFFRDVIAPRHILYIYDRMLVQALFYDASLRCYDKRICERTGNLLDSDQETGWQELREQRKEFIRFTNQYWFHSVTEQMQGKEIFRLMQQELGLRERYETIKDELERTDEFLQTEYEQRMANWSEKVGRRGFMVAILALWFTLLPIVLPQDITLIPRLFWALLVPIGVYFLWEAVCKRLFPGKHCFWKKHIKR